MEYLEQIYEKIYVITEILNVIYDEIKELNKQSKFSDFKINFSWHLNLWAKKKRVALEKSWLWRKVEMILNFIPLILGPKTIFSQNA